ncbi:MAG TPA: DUF3108 domain-containing protein [Bryobacteraceae bacterium]|nr:DUF3108 domain-containing protein [Bryobacteraceae bacterium]
MRTVCLFLAAALVGSPQNATAPAVKLASESQTTETLQYGVEWRLVRAGTAKLSFTPHGEGLVGDLHLESQGLVSRLYKIDDTYRVNLDSALCGTSSVLKANEGKRKRETRVTYDGARKKATYLERDLVKNAVVLTKEIEIPGCVHDFVAGLQKIRGLRLEPGQAVDVPVSDGKKFAKVRVEAQERETVKTPLGSHRAMRYEVFLFNDVILKREARCYVWISDDPKKLPVQIRVKMQFLIGTVNLALERS